MTVIKEFKFAYVHTRSSNIVRNFLRIYAYILLYRFILFVYVFYFILFIYFK